MSVTPKIHLVAFDDRLGAFIFVAVPDERGRYVRTHRSVAFVHCPQCGATVGEPCRRENGDGYGVSTHVSRRNLASRMNRGQPADDVLHERRLPDPVPDEWMEAAA